MNDKRNNNIILYSLKFMMNSWVHRKSIEGKKKKKKEKEFN